MEAKKRLILIFSILGLDNKTDPYSCRKVARKLNKYNTRGEWTYSYIRNIYNGEQPPSRYIAPAIEKLYKSLTENPPRKRHRKIIEANSQEQLDEWNELTADELRHALDREVILRKVETN